MTDDKKERRRSLRLRPEDERHIEKLRALYQKTRNITLTEQDVIRWALADAARLLGADVSAKGSGLPAKGCGS